MRIRPLRDAITWSHWYRFVSYARGSLWIVPFFSVAIELIVSRFIQGLDARLNWTLLGLGMTVWFTKRTSGGKRPLLLRT